MRHFHSISSNVNESIAEKQLYAGKVPSFPTFVTTNGNILCFLYKKSNVGIRQIYAIIIQQIVTMPIYGKEALNICHPT